MSEERVVPYEIDVMIDGDLDGVFRSVRAKIGDPVELMSLNHERTPEAQRDLKWFLEGWGWSSDGRWLRGLYGDFTDPEDDEKLFTALAPYVRSGSRIICGDERYEHLPYFAWVFRGGKVERRPVERIVRFVIR